MENKVLKVIKEYRLIQKGGDNIVLGLSGGARFYGTFIYFIGYKRDYRFNIYIAHLNHGVRGRDALEDQIFVEELSKDLGLPCYSKTVNMDEYAKKTGLSSEEAGRKLRYDFFS